MGDSDGEDEVLACREDELPIRSSPSAKAVGVAERVRSYALLERSLARLRRASAAWEEGEAVTMVMVAASGREHNGECGCECECD